METKNIIVLIIIIIIICILYAFSQNNKKININQNAISNVTDNINKGIDNIKNNKYIQNISQGTNNIIQTIDNKANYIFSQNKESFDNIEFVPNQNTWKIKDTLEPTPGWCGPDSNVIKQSQFPDCVNECKVNSKCNAIRWINHTNDCALMSSCDTSNNSSDWGHMTIKKPVNNYLDSLKKNLNKKGEPVFVLGNMGITPWGGASGKYFKPEAKWIWITPNARGPVATNIKIPFIYEYYSPNDVEATMYVNIDNMGEIYVNDNKIADYGGGWGGNTGKFNINLVAGINKIKIIAWNTGNTTNPNPAGLIVSVVDSRNNDSLFVSNGDWKISVEELLEGNRGYVSNIERGLQCCPNNECDKITFVGDSYVSPERNKLVRTFYTRENYCLKFIIKPTGTYPQWSNVLHSTISNRDCCSENDRVPGIWFIPNSTRLHVRVPTSTTWNDGINTNKLPMNKDTMVMVKADPEKLTVQFHDGNNLFYNMSKYQSGRRGVGNSRFYLSDPWYEPAKCVIKNIEYYYDKSDGEGKSTYTNPCKDSNYPHPYPNSNYDICYSNAGWNAGGKNGSAPCFSNGKPNWCNISGGSKPGVGCSNPPICGQKFKLIKSEYITGEDAIICRGRGYCPGESLVSQKLIQNKVHIKCSTYIDDTLVRNHQGPSSTNSSDSEYLLHNYNKQWWVGGGANKRVSAVFNFSVPIKLTNFIFATYNGGSVGGYKGWNLYYKKDNSWVKVLDYNNRSIYIPSANYITSSDRTYGIPIPNSDFSREWKFEVLPTRNVYIYWVKMFGDYLVPFQNINDFDNDYIKYGDSYYLKNLHSEGSYLAACGYSDTCTGGSYPRNNAVSTYRKNNSYISENPERKRGKWVIKRCNIGSSPAGCSNAETLNYGDVFSLQMENSPKWYLVTCSYRKCNSYGLLDVSVGKWLGKENSVMSGNAQYWKIISTDNPNQRGPVKKGDKIKLLNMWGPGTYLNTCGYIKYCGKGGVYAVNTTRKGTSDSQNDVSNWIFEE